MEKTFNTGAALKAMARGQLLGNYGAAISADMTCSLISTVAAYICSQVIKPDSGINTLFYLGATALVYLLMSVLSLGLCYFYLRLISGERAGLQDIFYGFKGYADRAIAARVLVLLSVLPASIPGAVAGAWYYRSRDLSALTLLMGMLFLGFILYLFVITGYSQVFYVLLDFPELTVTEAMGRSNTIMRGKRLKLIGIYISFVPYFLLAALSIGIAYIWIMPYLRATMAEFYLDIAV